MKAHWWNQEFLVQCLAQANTRKSLLRTHTVFIFRLRKLRWCQLGFAQHGWQCHQKRSSKANLTCLSVLWRENALAQSDRSVKSILEIKISQKKKFPAPKPCFYWVLLVLSVTAQMQLLCLSLVHLCRQGRIITNIPFWCWTGKLLCPILESSDGNLHP